MTTPGESTSVRAGIYCRISLAQYGDTTKTADQERICRNLAGQLGWEVIDVYTDGSKSAWQANRKRHDWDRMLGDIDSGRINGVITYHGDRLIRRHEDLSALLKLSRSKGVRLASPTGTRSLDSYDDQFILEIECSMAKRESANISRRQKSRYERDRRNGKIMSQGPGGRRFGLCSDGVTLYPADRCELELRREVTEAEIIREAARRVLAGESANAIEADLRRRGWTTPAGKRMQHGTLKRWLCNPRYAGLMPDGETQAAWPAILGRETWERARLVLEHRAGAYPRGGGNGARYLLSGIAECGACGHAVMISHTVSRGYRSVVYGCGKREGGCGKVWRSAPLLDAYVGRMTVSQLNHPLRPDAEAPADPDSAAEWGALTVERAATEQQVKDYRTSAGRLSLLMARLDAIDARMAELRERESGSTRARLLETYRGTTWEQWLAEPLEVRRALVSAHFRVTVLPASKRGPGFRTEDVRLEPLGQG